jgi:acetylornithine deacetylase/succinyl-diaminopimelate desuccinylase-like protein
MKLIFQEYLLRLNIFSTFSYRQLFMRRLVPLFLFICLSVLAQKKTVLNELAAEFTHKSLPLLKEVLSIPNDAISAEWIEENIIWTEDAFNKRGFTTQRISTDGAPLVLASRTFPNAKKTVLVYLQMDGQPVDPSRWNQKSPYKPELKKQNKNGDWETIAWEKIRNYQDDWRIFARSTSDAKGPVVMFLAAMDALEKIGKNPNYNLKVILDYEEEMGSPNLPKAVNENRDLLLADFLVIFDGPMHRLNKPTLSFGARGISTFQLTTYGPKVPQHSGHFGNYVPNPAFKLSTILASMKNDQGKVLIPGFYDGIILDEKTKTILANTPHNEKQLQELLQLGGFDRVGPNYQEAIQYPSLNIRGMQSGWINEKVRTIIPAWARAEIDVRLVKESDPERLHNLIKKHIEGLGYLVLDREPTKEERLTNDKIATYTYKISYQSFRTDLDSEIGTWLRKALFRAFEEEPIRVRMSGGSIPISPFVNSLNLPAVAVPTVNRDNNQHSPNENLRLGNYRDGIKTILAVLTEKL